MRGSTVGEHARWLDTQLGALGIDQDDVLGRVEVGQPVKRASPCEAQEAVTFEPISSVHLSDGTLSSLTCQGRVATLRG